MGKFVALLRAVNVGGTGKLPMKDLVSLCENIGFTEAQTYIASGNVVFRSDKPETKVKSLLEAELEIYSNKKIDVIVRSEAEMKKVLAANPFPDMQPNRTVAIFLDARPASNALDDVVGQNKEEIALGKREVYVHYGEGMGKTKLRIPAAANGTARNMNTIAKLVEMLAAL